MLASSRDSPNGGCSKRTQEVSADSVLPKNSGVRSSSSSKLNHNSPLSNPPQNARKRIFPTTTVAQSGYNPSLLNNNTSERRVNKYQTHGRSTPRENPREPDQIQAPAKARRPIRVGSAISKRSYAEVAATAQPSSVLSRASKRARRAVLGNYNKQSKKRRVEPKNGTSIAYTRTRRIKPKRRRQSPTSERKHDDSEWNESVARTYKDSSTQRNQTETSSTSQKLLVTL